MKIKNIKQVTDSGWLKQRFGECFAQISVDTTLKLRSSVRDVARVTHGYVPEDTEKWAKDFENAPQGVEDLDFIFGYEGSDGSHVAGSIETDEALKAYIRRYPNEWEIVQMCLGLTRQKSRHACLPASELIQTKGGGLRAIVDCEGWGVYTGQGVKKRGSFSPWGYSKLLPQGEREVCEYTIDTGKVLRCTPDHLVLTEKGWVEIQKAFEEGLELKKSSTRIRQTEEDARSYAASRGGSLKAWGGNASSPSIWCCSKGHCWTQPFTVVRSYEYWCRKCSHQYRFRPTKRYTPIKRSASKCLNTYRRYDAKRGLDHDLTLQDVIKAKQSDCHYCGRQATGLERVDNTKGHTRANCVPACLRCNWMRGRYISHGIMCQVGDLLRKIDP